jgi:adenylylsulfate kinase
MDSHWRSIIKSITWRLIAVTVTILISYAWLHEWGSSIVLSLTANGIKAVIYYLHERGWNKIDFGRKKEVQEDYRI